MTLANKQGDSIQVRIARGLYVALHEDARALGLSTSEIATMLLADALERARARRYAPYRLPEGYGWDVFGQSYSADPEQGEDGDEGHTSEVVSIRTARKAGRCGN